MSYENKLDRLAPYEESQDLTQKQAVEVSRVNKFSPLMMVMRFEEHDASQVDKWLMIDLDEDFDAAFKMKEYKIH